MGLPPARSWSGVTIASKALDIALAQRGDPYVWGAEGPNAFDCSGLVFYAYHNAGLSSLHRLDADTYGNMVHHVARSALQPGMIVQPHPGHIQIYAGGNQIVEAPRTGLNVRRVPMWGWWRGGYFPGTYTPPAPSNVYPGHLIRYGDRGAAVYAIHHHFGGSGDVFGPRTLAFVKAFQRSHHLQVDGIVGPLTWRAMFHG